MIGCSRTPWRQRAAKSWKSILPLTICTFFQSVFPQQPGLELARFNRTTWAPRNSSIHVAKQFFSGSHRWLRTIFDLQTLIDLKVGIRLRYLRSRNKFLLYVLHKQNQNKGQRFVKAVFQEKSNHRLSCSAGRALLPRLQ